MRNAPMHLVMDAGAILVWARGDKRVRRYADASVRDKTSVFVSSATLAEVVRGDGPKDAPVSRALSHTDVLPVTEKIGRRAGKLLAHTGSSATVDAVVVATALDVPGGALVLTTDPFDLSKLAEDHRDVRVVTV